ncbi:LysR family transcriptional regulator [Falsigemmobacter intermedius]|uniref:LysR family transcriptional regulator n=1 Tax=Falsigemmobacter intermedius TaxID=1553448 RepID=UPI003F09D3D5
MDIRQLRYFVAIAEQGSFSRAAALLHVAQPALSLHVRNMEADLGTKLLFRSPKGVIPTEAGAVLLCHARTIIGQLAVAEEEVRGQQADPSGEVRLGLPGTIGEVLSVPLIRAAHLRYPKIRLRIAEAMSGFVLDWMREARIDLAVVYREVNETGIDSVRLLDEELVFFAPAEAPEGVRLPPPGQPVALRDLAQVPMILPGAAHGLRELLTRYAISAGISLTTVIEVDSYHSIKELVLSGFGCSILPGNAVHREIAEGRLQGWQIRAPEILRSVWLAHATSRPMSHSVAAIQSLACEVLQNLARSGSWAGARPLPLPVSEP